MNKENKARKWRWGYARREYLPIAVEVLALREQGWSCQLMYEKFIAEKKITMSISMFREYMLGNGTRALRVQKVSESAVETPKKATPPAIIAELLPDPRALRKKFKETYIASAGVQKIADSAFVVNSVDDVYAKADDNDKPGAA